jgi:hypothetical protein
MKNILIMTQKQLHLREDLNMSTMKQVLDFMIEKGFIHLMGKNNDE